MEIWGAPAVHGEIRLAITLGTALVISIFLSLVVAPILFLLVESFQLAQPGQPGPGPRGNASQPAHASTVRRAPGPRIVRGERAALRDEAFLIGSVEAAVARCDHERVAETQLAGHFADHNRLYAGAARKVSHIAFTFRDGAGDQGRLESIIRKSSGQPHNVFSRTPDV